MKRVISLVGMLGVGKTTTINALKQLGYGTLKEDYLEISNAISCDNRMILSKWAWISHWFYKVETYFRENPNNTDVFVDRSAIEAGLWTDTCKPLFEPIQLSLNEFCSLGYQMVNICLKCDYTVLQERLQKRLFVEPIRLRFNENNPQFIQSLYQSYTKAEPIWDLVIDAQTKSTDQICDIIINFLHLSK